MMVFGLDITSVCTYLLGHAQTNSSLIVQNIVYSMDILLELPY